MSPHQTRLAYRPELDGIRGLAILLVLFDHLYLPGTDAFGWVGVELFFVLSGFLITSVLLVEHDAGGPIDLRRFYVRRVRRLAPALLALIVVVTTVDLMVGRGDGFWSAGLVVLYVANWPLAVGQSLGGLNHTWSLSIEEQFYLLWPIVLITVLRRGGTPLAAKVAVGIGIASFAWRLGLWDLGGSISRVYNGTDARLDGLMAGCAFALLRPLWSPGRRTVGAALILILAVCLVPIDTVGAKTIMLSVGFGAATLATLVLVSAHGGVLAFRPLVAVGRLSYSLYLWHYPIMYGAHLLWGTVPLWTVAVAFGAAWVSYRFIEQPFRYRAVDRPLADPRPSGVRGETPA